MNSLAAVLHTIHERMAGKTGSVTLHFKDGKVQVLEFRDMMRLEQEKKQAA